jgi:hypothetical protein
VIEFVFTVDYEIFGDGRGSLKEHVLEPARRLMSLFEKAGMAFVLFVEAAEMEMIESAGSDPDIGQVRSQVLEFHRKGIEIGLHIHPWWYGGTFERGGWDFDDREYNLCKLPDGRIREIVDRSIAYLRSVLGEPDFRPFAFRAGHLIFQPTQPLAGILAERGVKADSSVYKGGLWRRHRLNYRPALKNGDFWTFSDDAARADSRGALLEVPVYAKMVPVWRMFTSKRVGLQSRGVPAARTRGKIASRLRDFLRFSYPQKLDLGQMTADEIRRMVNGLIREDEKGPARYRPVTALLHTKDPIDYSAVEALLDLLGQKGIRASDFAGVYRRAIPLSGGSGGDAPRESGAGAVKGRER